MTLDQWLLGLVTFKTYYRIVPQKSMFYKFNISVWRWYFPFWTTGYPWDGFRTKEEAAQYMKELADAEIFYTL